MTDGGKIFQINDEIVEKGGGVSQMRSPVI